MYSFRQFCAPSTYPNAIIPREAFGFHGLDTSPVADSPTAQAVAALHLVSYHPHLKEAERDNKMLLFPDVKSLSDLFQKSKNALI